MKVKKGTVKTPEQLEENLVVDPIANLFDAMDTEDAAEQIAPDTGVTPDNFLVPSKFFDGGLTPVLENYLPPGLVLTAQEKQMVTQGVKRLSSGLRSSMPITCYGDSCPFRLQCPFHQIGKAPVGKACPVESMLIDVYTKRYIDEFDVDSNFMSEVTTMTMLAATHVLEMRALTLLGKDDNENPDGLIKNVVGFNNEEEPIVQLQEHPALNILERAWRWRRNLLESLVGTRKEKYKRDAVSGGVNPASVSSAAADMRSTISKLTVIDIDED